MPSLRSSLQDQDRGHLYMIADLWRIELDAPNFQLGIDNLINELQSAELFMEVFSVLPNQAKLALQAIKQRNGRMPKNQFLMLHGNIRQVGSAKRDREKLYREPATISEWLFFRGLIAFGTFPTEVGLTEQIYIPDEIILLLPKFEEDLSRNISRVVSESELTKFVIPNFDIIDHAATLLAAIRNQYSTEKRESISKKWDIPLEFLHSLLSANKLVDSQGEPVSPRIKLFLESTSGDAILTLWKTWTSSKNHNDLQTLLPIFMEGEWKNDSFSTRKILLNRILSLDTDTWWSIPAIIQSFHSQEPTFQRQGGEFDSWYIRDKHTNQYLRGFDYWHQIEGSLIQAVIEGPLFWLGIVEIAAKKEGEPIFAFRFSKWSQSILNDIAPQPRELVSENIFVDSSLAVLIPSTFPRDIRYQFARFLEWEGKKKENYVYRITPASLSIALDQGLTIAQLLSLLKKYTSHKLPKSIEQSLNRWTQFGTQSKLEKVTILRLYNPEALTALKESKAARFLGDSLGATSVIINPGAWQKVVAKLGELGYLSEINFEE